LKFLLGLLLGLLLVPAAVYLYFTVGSAPVATNDPDMPFEPFFARKALHARIAKEAPKTVPIEANEANYLGGVQLYKEHCAMCHGLPLAPRTPIAAGMHPRPPKLFEGKGVTDDPPGVSYWKITNGIRLSGMPGFGKSLSDAQTWQLAILLANADKLPASVKTALVAPPASNPPPASSAPGPATPSSATPPAAEHH
jgi:thiosulfate dehydrogenase